MNTPNETIKFTCDLPKSIHKKLKTLAAATGKTMKDLIVEAMPYIEKTNKLSQEDHADMGWLLKAENAQLLQDVKEGLGQKEYVEIDLEKLEKHASE